MKNQLVNFIKGNERVLVLEKSRKKYHVVAVPRSPKLTFIYISTVYCSLDNPNPLITDTAQMCFAGAYSHKTNDIYLPSYDLELMLGDKFPEENNNSHLSKTVSQLIASCVENIVGNDFKNVEARKFMLDEKKIKFNKDDYANRMKYYHEHSVYEDAKRRFLKEERPEDVTYTCWSKLDVESNDILEYLEDGENAIERMAYKYIEKYYSSIKFQLEANEILKAELGKLYADDTNILNLVKRLQDAINSGDYKTVNVTVSIDNVEHTFKYEANKLKNGSIEFSAWYMPVAKERQAFYDKFGRSADFRIESIKEITYGRKTIYTK